MNGIWLPPGTDAPGAVLAGDLIPEAKRLAEWARKYPRKGEPALDIHAVAQLVATQGHVHLWDRDKQDAIFKLVCSELGLNSSPAAPPERKRGNLKAVCSHRWRDQSARFRTCRDCGLVTEKPIDLSGTADPSRVTRTDAGSMERISTRVPTSKDVKIKEKMPK